ncbi:MAG: transglycosylase SLT domain-containing protein, partial [Gemmatimonadetes bacterium]|nr:transglycosylase SLT domain-containing protein [Gemmatimonadota bacterium]
GDCAAQWAASVVCALHWYNPLAWYAASRLRLEAEHAADDVALAGRPAVEYARHLLHVASSIHSASMHAATAMARPTQLRRRMEAVLDPERPRGGAAGRVTGAALAGVALIVALASVEVADGAAAVATAAPTDSAPDFARRFGVARSVASAVERAALAEGVDPELAFRLVRAESGFSGPLRRGERGVGLARILPSTARSMQPGVTAAELRDPDTSLRLAFRYLHRAIRQRPDDLAGAVAIYGRGPRGSTAGDAAYVRGVLGARTGMPAYRGSGVVR